VSRALYPALHRVQRGLAVVSRRLHAGRPQDRPISWVVGTVEIASMVANFARAVPESYSVMLAHSRFYDFAYDYEVRQGRGAWWRYWFAAPWEFGRLAAHARGFVYVGANSFLLNEVDDRDWEFGFLRRHGIPVVCLFTGSDIRSPELLRRFQKETGLETIVTYLDQVSPALASPAYDDLRRRIATVADRHANAIFNARVDQLSYLERETEPFPYFFPDDQLVLDASKHRAPGRKIVVHAPSSPIIKGTQVVRAAIQRLRSEGYDFEYRELIALPHDRVLDALREAHIVLNEFYAFMPGVFGVEAMASGCALLTRADETIETDLPPGSNDAWVVTTAADVYANLRALLDEPKRIQVQAAAGLAWVQEHATVSASGARVRALLDTITDEAAARG
jgi:hypothetical protein